jgi:hypothetical protein
MAALSFLSFISGVIAFLLTFRIRRQSNRQSVVSMRAVSDLAAPYPAEVPNTVLAYAKTLLGVTLPFPNIFNPADLLARAVNLREVDLSSSQICYHIFPL